MLKIVSVTALSLALLPALSMASDAGTLKTGEKLYKSACIACHSTGAANAPKLGNKQAWAPLIAKGMDEMMNVALHGKGAMPARGGTKADDATLRAAVEYMVSRAQ
ncbi:c-type cytochrome [Castellaniella ginsengisoli]|uniref:C-type cytochrome n=1 Tax=Castellaniella denitrificans TaxID=56119 RepID=A0ABT4M0P7_9BURK|nr:c-type cytochrome [Castellaniella denitrificans]MCZ4328884.1 c-type cytochrome [Castellaniella denitrificans]